MKLKLLIAPLLVLLIIVMAIWVVAPAYRELQAQKEELAGAKLKLADIQEKNAQAARLKQQLSGNTEQRDLILKYIPPAAQEESVIENLNALAQSEGLVVSSILMADESAKIAAKAAVNNSQRENEANVLAANTLSASLSVVGPYEKIKSFIGKLSALKRGNDVIALKISGKDGNAASLAAELTSNFAYFTGGSASISANNSIFSKGSFDTAFIEKLKDKLSTEIVPINIGETGKSNPFLP